MLAALFLQLQKCTKYGSGVMGRHVVGRLGGEQGVGVEEKRQHQLSLMPSLIELISKNHVEIKKRNGEGTRKKEREREGGRREELIRCRRKN